MQARRFLFLSMSAALLVASSVTGCFFNRCDRIGPAVIGNGNVKTVTRDLTSFDAVELGGIGKLNITIGDKSSLMITTDENLMPLVNAEVRSNRLIINTQKPVISKHGLVFEVTTPSIRSIDSQGAASVSASSIKNETLSVKQSGVGSVFLIGQTNKLIVELSGAGKINAEFLKAQIVEADVSGVGSITVSAEKELKANVSGAGSVTYRGDPKVDAHVSGVGSVHK